MGTLLDRIRSHESGSETGACHCEPAFEGERLVVESDDCEGTGDLVGESSCRATVVRALEARDVESVLTRAGGAERAYEDDAAALLVAAGRFADAAAEHDSRLAGRTRHDPLGAAREATGRAGPVSRLAAETGLAEGAERVRGYDDALRPYVGPAVSRTRVALRPPPDAELISRRELETGAVARTYDRPGAERPTYHVVPVEYEFDADRTAALSAAAERLAAGAATGERAPRRVARQVADGRDAEAVGRALAKHARGHGILRDLFADGRVSDVFATAPVAENGLHVRVDGEAMRTNVRLTDRGVDALASRFRLSSGRAFSRASPTLDATATIADRRVRVAGVTEPVSDGIAFAFRAHDREAWTLPALVANDTLPPAAAALLSLSVERGRATLLAGTRGAGKTTLLAALLWEVPASTRTVVIEDTPELPVKRLQAAGRDVQRFRADEDDAGPTMADALRTALRFGEGALVVGEVRGAEAGVLYEAMRVGASGGAVLGTIHGDGAEAVRERVVTDLGVPGSSFAATDLLVTLESCGDERDASRRVRAVEEVRRENEGVGFETLFEQSGDGLDATGRIARENSRIVDRLRRPTETYADVREVLGERTAWFERQEDAGAIRPDAVCAAHAQRRDGC